MKKFLLILVIVVMSVVGIMLGFDIVLANINYSQNMKVWGEIETPQIIYYQQDYKNIKFGLGDIVVLVVFTIFFILTTNMFRYLILSKNLMCLGKLVLGYLVQNLFQLSIF